MLGGGSPNLIAPILKDWRDTLTPEQQLRLPLSEIQNSRPELPLIISDLASELWKRAIVFATIECKGSPQALQFATMDEESEQLRSQNRTLLDQIESRDSENLSLREQLAQIQAIAQAATDRAIVSDERCAAALRDLREEKLSSTRIRRAHLAMQQLDTKLRRRRQAAVRKGARKSGRKGQAEAPTTRSSAASSRTKVRDSRKHK
jgi:hypothetical protein